jgi:hypothetical protein
VNAWSGSGRPLPGGSGRVPTGAVQFRDDWPGLFVRGDAAIILAFHIRSLEAVLAQSQDLLVQSALSKLVPIAEVIEREVKVR